MHKYFANTLFIGKQVVHLPTCHSTNDMTAKLVPQKSLFDGAIVITDEQTAGRGQRGNSWEAAPGKNLTFSIYLRPLFLDIGKQFYLNVAVSLGITDFLKDYLPEGVAIKWPNDIFYYGSKLGGILIENSIRRGRIEHSIVGIGLNVNQQTFASPAANSLARICQQEFELEAILQQLVLNLEQRYLELKREEYDNLIRAYLAKMYWYKEERTFKDEHDFFSGEICGVDENGRLMINTVSGIRTYSIKEIVFIQ